MIPINTVSHNNICLSHPQFSDSDEGIVGQGGEKENVNVHDIKKA